MNYQTSLRNAIIFITLLTAGLLYSCTPVYAQQQRCAPTEVVEISIARQGGTEVLILSERSREDAVLRLFVDFDERKWVIIITNTDGTSCFMIDGDGITAPLPPIFESRTPNMDAS